METTNPDAEPPHRAVERAEPRGWDHDHCDFCWAKFMVPEQRQQDPEILTAGYTPALGPGRTWICPTCFEDFRERFGWTEGTARRPDRGATDA